MESQDIESVIKELGRTITAKGAEKLRTKLSKYITLREEVIYWLDDKNINPDEDVTQDIVEEVISRWDDMADEDIVAIAEEAGYEPPPCGETTDENTCQEEHECALPETHVDKGEDHECENCGYNWSS